MEHTTQEQDEQEKFKGDENDPSGVHFIEWKRTLLRKAKRIGGQVMIDILNGDLVTIPTPYPARLSLSEAAR